MFPISVDEVTFTEQITPYLPLVGTVAGGVLIGAFAIYNRRRGAVETKAPDVSEIWAREERQNRELDAERRFRRRMEALVGDLWLAFTGYAHRVQDGGPHDFTVFEQKTVDAASDIGTTGSTHSSSTN